MDMAEEIKSLLAEQGEAITAFKDRVDASLASEAKEREALELRLSRSGRGVTANGELTEEQKNELKAIGAFVKGSDAELKAMSVGSDPDGGYTVLPSMASAIRLKLREVSVIGRLARQVTIESDTYAEPMETGDVVAEWVGESAGRPNLDGPQIDLHKIPLHEIYTAQLVTQKLLDTSAFELGTWVSDRISNKFVRAEAASFVNGSGINQPRGFLTRELSTDDDSSRTSGHLQYIATGTDGAFGTSGPDKMIDLVYSLRSPYRANAVFVMNSKTAGTVRKFKDSEGQFLWADSLTVGQPNSFLGYRVVIDEEMPDIANDAAAVAFGDFREGYTVANHDGTKMLTDPYSQKPHVVFYAYRRVGGDLSDSDAIKLLRFSAS